jgi:hypothetical protein
MRDWRHVPPGPWRGLPLVAVLLLAFVTSCQGDLMSMPSFGADNDAPGRDAAQLLPLGTWKRDNLHCAAGRCERWYEIEVSESGMLRVDLYAPVGEELPDCEMRLETWDGEPLSVRTGRVQTQRRLRHEADEGTYRLRVVSKGNQELFDFEVVAEVRKGEKKSRTAGTKKKQSSPQKKKQQKKSSKPPDIPVAKLPTPPDADELEQQIVEEPVVPAEAEPVPEPIEELPPEPPAPQAVWVVAEVLDVEEADGEPTAVMIEAGAPDGIVPGLQGELYEDDAVIGQIEVVEVYPSGSRAKIVGPLTAPVSFDTLSRIQIPPDGE